MYKSSIWLSLTLLVFVSWWGWVVTTTIPGSQDPGEPGPQAFPLLLAEVLGVLALLLLAQGLFRWKQSTASRETVEGVTGREVRIVGLTFLLFMLFAFLMDKIGFLLATPIVLSAAMVGILGMRSWRRVLAVAVGFTLGSHLIFNLLLKANLPHGSWIRL